VGSGDFFRSTYTTGYTINFDAQGGSVSPSSQAVTYYATVGSLPAPTRSGYSFLGWNTSADGSGTTYTDSSVYFLNTNLTLYANFDLIPVERKRSSGSSVTSRVNNLLAMDNQQAAETLKKEFPNQFPVSNSEITIDNILTKFVFIKNLKYLDVNTDVKELQKYLNNNGFLVSLTGLGSKGFETTKFGPATKKALIKFQITNNIKPSIGIFGPITRGIVNGK